MIVPEFQALAIGIMAVLTYGTRAAGLLLMQFVNPGPKQESLMKHLSGSVLAALFAPALLVGDMPLRIGVIAAVGVMLCFRNSLAAMLASVMVAGALRWLA